MCSCIFVGEQEEGDTGEPIKLIVDALRPRSRVKPKSDQI